MTDNKTSRASQTRSKTDRPKVWTPPSSLDAPKAPTGFRHRWIRVETMGFDDTKNLQGKLRSGWELVRADEYPGSEYPVINEGKYKGMIGVGGLVLARIPEEIALGSQPYIRDPGMSISDLILEVAGKLGENIKVKRFARFALGE